MEYRQHWRDDGQPWFDPKHQRFYSDNGHWYYSGEDHANDLIAEWVEPETAEDVLARTSIPEAMQELAQVEQPHKLTAADIEDHSPVPATGSDDYSSYAALADVLNDAYMQAARGKGNARHSAGKPFLEQPILEIVRMLDGIDGHAFQGMKKLQEASRMVKREQHNAAIHELYGVINYAAAAVIRIREIETEAGIPGRN